MPEPIQGNLRDLAFGGETKLEMPISTVHAFAVRYRAPNGEVYYGTFEARLPSADDYRRIAIATAGLVRGAQWQSLPQELQTLILAMARCSVLITSAPKWFEKPLSELGPELFLAISQEIERFEREFFRAIGGNEQDPIKALVEIQPVEPGATAENLARPNIP